MLNAPYAPCRWAPAHARDDSQADTWFIASCFHLCYKSHLVPIRWPCAFSRLIGSTNAFTCHQKSQPRCYHFLRRFCFTVSRSQSVPPWPIGLGIPNLSLNINIVNDQCLHNDAKLILTKMCLSYKNGAYMQEVGDLSDKNKPESLIVNKNNASF